MDRFGESKGASVRTVRGLYGQSTSILTALYPAFCTSDDVTDAQSSTPTWNMTGARFTTLLNDLIKS